MTDWHKYWNTDSIVHEDDFLRQVGKTVNGQPVEQVIHDAIVDDIVMRLRLNPTDRVLDLCCGNGLITRQCAEHCQHITGVDFSEPLIRVATRHFARANIEYRNADVCSLPEELTTKAFTKVYMYEALQHLSSADAESILQLLRKSASGQAPVLIASVPERERIWDFYDTTARRAEYHRRVEEGTEAIGHWWTKTELADLGARCGYAVHWTAQNPILHGSHYRFDALFLPVTADP